MSLRRGLLFMLVLIGLSSPGCAELGRPPEKNERPPEKKEQAKNERPPAKKEQAQKQEARGDSSMLDEDAEHAQLERDLLMYAD